MRLYHDLGFASQGRLLAKQLQPDAVPRVRPREVLKSGAELGRLRSTDMEAIFELWRASGEFVRFRTDGREKPERFKVYLDRPAPAAFGVWRGERLIGGVLTAYDREKGWVERLAVHPDFRRAGVAKVLVTTAIQSLKARGAVVISALIEPDNVSSQQLFEACGFLRQPEYLYYAIRYGHEY